MESLKEIIMCNTCDKTFKTEGRFNRHQATKKHIAKEEECSKSAKIIKLQSYKAKAKSNKQHHREQGTFRCSVCERNYGSNSDLKKHNKTKRHQKIESAQPAVETAPLAVSDCNQEQSDTSEASEE